MFYLILAQACLDTHCHNSVRKVRPKNSQPKSVKKSLSPILNPACMLNTHLRAKDKQPRPQTGRFTRLTTHNGNYNNPVEHSQY
jgi:hypothetical protein